MSYMDAKGYLSKYERIHLKVLAEDVSTDGVIVNIGVEYGASLHCLRAGAPEARLVGIDIDCSKLVGDVDVELIESPSAEVEFDNPVDLLFVDGNHTFDGVTADIETWLPRVVFGGVAVFHDCLGNHPAHVIVNKAVSMWYESTLKWIEDDAWYNALKLGDEFSASGKPYTMRLFRKLWEHDS